MGINRSWLSRSAVLLFVTCLSTDEVRAEVWHLLDRPPVEAESQGERLPGQWVELDAGALHAVLERAPLEFTSEMEHRSVLLQLPTPDGTFAAFDLVEAPIMHPQLAARFPEIRTYWAQGVDDPHASARLDWTPQGFHAQVLTPRGSWYIDPFDADAGRYRAYALRDARRDPAARCGTGTATWLPERPVRFGTALNLRTSGPNLRTYALACAATGEYTAFHGGTVADGQAAIVTTINRVTGILEVEITARLTLVANNDQLVFTDSATDPFTNDDLSAMLGENQTLCDGVIGPSNYDIGHVFGTVGGGLAAVGVLCEPFKAFAGSGLSIPTDAFFAHLAAHEFGHQLGAGHSFNGVIGGCQGGRFGPSATEIGSGSTIMAYPGICGIDNVETEWDPYYTGISHDEMRTVLVRSDCATRTPTGNNAPNVNAGPDRIIPQQTPFTLTATATDPQGDPLTYCWEQMDLGPAQALSDVDNGLSPLFRSRPPRESPSRTFPRLIAVRNNLSEDEEKLPTTVRTMTFRVTARDNRAGGGGVAQDEITIATTANGPFRITSFNSPATLPGVQLLTWDTADTESAPVLATQVEIALSTNSGRTFDTVLLASTPNDGAEVIELPDLTTTEARLRVRPIDNIFFDMNDVDLTIVPVCAADIDGNGSVNLSDLAQLLADFGTAGPDNPADINGDGTVNLSDLAEVLATFGRSCD